MKNRNVGNLIYKTREEKKITQKHLCDGLCSTQTLSNIELGERMPDIFLLECLLQRLGLSSDDLETVLFEDEYQEIEIRDIIEDKIESGQFLEAEQVLEEHFQESSDGIRRQYYNQIKAVLESLKSNHKDSVWYIERALACTHVCWREGNKESILLSTREIELLCMMADEYMLQANDVEAKNIVNFLRYYLEHNTIHDIELVKTYPKVVYLAESLSNSKKEKVDSICCCEKALHLLTTCDSTVFLAEIMTVLIKNYHDMGLTNKKIRLEKQLESLEILYSECNRKLYETQYVLKWFNESYRREYFLCPEMIKGERIARGIERKKLIEGIYEDIETLGRIENGCQNPSYKKYALLMKRLNMPSEKYSGMPIYDDGIFQLQEQITQYLIEHNYEDARIALEKLKLLVEEDDYIAHQYIAKEETFLAYKLKQIGEKEFTERIHKALVQTYAGSLDELSRIPTLGEANILNYLLLSYRKNEWISQSLSMYQKLLESYQNSRIGEKYHYRAMTLFYRNYLLLLEENNYCEKGLELSQRVLKYEMSAFRGQGLDYICSEIVCIYEQTEMDETEKKKAIEKYLRLAFYISDLFSKRTNNVAIDAYYRKHVDDRIQWYF